ncbi:MAG: N-acetylglucosamine-6-phosphate deacetylase [Halioglobus sp.]|nr:N-acetylglucosamine-6-phosphate deacetylase [Halioglobus sp.]
MQAQFWRRLLASHVLHCSQLFDGEHLLEDQLVHVEQGRISRVVACPESPGEGVPSVPLLVPGLVDLQVNGGGGVLFNEAPTLATLETMAAAHRAGGTVGFLPTLISGRREEIAAAIDAVAAATNAGSPGVLGIHLEGPWLNQSRRGAHAGARLDVPTQEDVALCSSLVRGKTLVTLAPEIAGEDTIRALAARGVIVCGGHSEADLECTRRALQAGMSGFTHLFNAMPPLLSRDPGMVGAALTEDDAWFGIIADGHHVHPVTVRAAVRAKQPARAVLVTDAMSTVGAPDATFRLADAEVALRDGRLSMPDGTLAGAHLDMLSAVNNVARFADIDWFEAVRMGSLYPARALGLEAELGRVAAGYRASFLVLGAQRMLRETWVDGVRYVIAAD